MLQINLIGEVDVHVESHEMPDPQGGPPMPVRVLIFHDVATQIRVNVPLSHIVANKIGMELQGKGILTANGPLPPRS